ncbi:MULTISPECIES: hypothetical protein [unclassified Curtobacterium]|uniref:hypothetical protein n=1 Tax=unclassified Curtobacterium TaxID=257496 RepID=UPI000DAA55C0|nr:MULTISPECIES: hypothetical protein [unclassified Curtobacterium]PZE72454.1 hypothetical protein DEJ12_02065 [Curtobacterium sp. MCLR17_059]PZF55820.1 hypothetical protein DEJ10_01155 [Curtobacterium sp. MCLR17_057]
MEPRAFDGAAWAALMLLMPTSVLFVAAALRRLRLPRWTWLLYLLGVAGGLAFLHVAGHTRYEAPDTGSGSNWWDFGQFVGLGLGRIGIGINAVAATVWMLRRPRLPDDQLDRRENRLVVLSYLVMAVASALPAMWWGIGLGIVPLLIELPIVVAGWVCLAVAVVLYRRRILGVPGADRSLGPVWPVDAIVVAWLVGTLAVGPLFVGSGLPVTS